jgi:hypothetical protein
VQSFYEHVLRHSVFDIPWLSDIDKNRNLLIPAKYESYKMSGYTLHLISVIPACLHSIYNAHLTLNPAALWSPQEAESQMQLPNYQLNRFNTKYMKLSVFIIINNE